MTGAPPFFQDYSFIVYVFYVFVKRANKPPSDLTVSLGGLFFAFPQQIFFVAVHLVLLFFGQALALVASLVRGVDVGQTQQVVGGGAVELADGNQHLLTRGSRFCSQPRTAFVLVWSFLAMLSCVSPFNFRNSANRSPIIPHTYLSLL